MAQIVITEGEAMDVNEIKEWVLIVSTSASILSLVASAIWTIVQYRAKLREEELLAISSRSEVDVRLVSAFTQLMDLAMGRREHVVSEKAVEEIFKLGLITSQDFNENFRIRQKGSTKLSEYSVVVLPVGESGQDAAIAAISALGNEYKILKDAARVGLKSISSHHPRAEKILQEIKQ